MDNKIKLMPAPIAVAWKAFEAENRPFYKLNRLVDTYETLMKYVGILAIQNFYEAGLAKDFLKIDKQVRTKIAVPMLGTWKYISKDVLGCFKDRKDAIFCPDLYLFYFKDFGQKTLHDQFYGESQALLDLRNEYLGHGATLGKNKSEELVAEHTPILYTLLDKTKFLRELPLYYVQAEVHNGTFEVKPMIGAEYRSASLVLLSVANLPVGHVIIHNPVTGKVLDLHPLIVYLICNETLATWDTYWAQILGKLDYIEHEGRTREMPDIETILQAKRGTLESLVEQGILTNEQLERPLERERAALQGKAGLKSIELLVLFCIAKAPLSLKEAAAMLKADPLDVQRAFEVIRTVLVESEQEGHFTPFHAGFREYVLNLDDYSETKFHCHADTIANITESMIAYCADWQHHCSLYALRYYPDHLFETQRYDDLFVLAREAAFQGAQAQAFPDDPGLLLHTLQTALQGAADIDNAVRMAEFLLAHARRLIAITQESPLNVSRSGNLKRAWELADLFEIERCTLWHLLLAWELKDMGRLEEARATLERLREKGLHHFLSWPAGWKGEYAAYLLAQVFEVSEDTFVVTQQQLLENQNRSILCGFLSARGYFAVALEAAQGIDYPRNRAVVLGDIAQAQVQAGENEAARTTWVAALETAQGINVAWERVFALAQIASTQAQAGDHAAARKVSAMALETVQEIDDAEKRALALRDIAQAQAQAGDFAVALKTAHRIKREDIFVMPLFGEPEPDVLAMIAIAQAQAGEFDAALETAQGIENGRERAKVLGNIAQAYARAGEFVAALKTALQPGSKRGIGVWNRVEVLIRIAVAQAQAGDHETAQRHFSFALETVVPRSYGSLKESARKKGGIEKLGKITSAEAKLLGKIAVAQVEIEEREAARTTFATALDTAQGIDHVWWRGDTLKCIAQMQAQAGEFAAAIVTAQGIDYPKSQAKEIVITSRRLPNQVEVLCQIAVIQGQAGKPEAARSTFAIAFGAAHEAFGTVQESEEKWYRAETLRDIAELQAQVGDFTVALEIVQRIDYTFWRANALKDIAQTRNFDAVCAIWAAAVETAQGIDDVLLRIKALKEIALAQAQVREFDAALETAQGIDEADRASVFRDIAQAQAQAQAQAGEFDAALETTQRIDVPYLRSEMLKAIAKAQAQTGEFGAALETAQRIDDEWIRAKALEAIAKTQAQAGKTEAAQVTWAAVVEAIQGIGDMRRRVGALLGVISKKQTMWIEQILEDRDECLPEIAKALAEMESKEYFKQLLTSCAYYLDTAHFMCSLLAWLYPEQVVAIADVLLQQEPLDKNHEV